MTKLFSGNVGALSNSVRALVKIPASGGAVTITGATFSVGTTGGTTWPQLVDLGTAGTAVDHVLADGGTIAGLAAVQTLTMQSNPVVEAGHYIGVKEGNVAAMPTVSIIGFSYEEGK
jgi:hypothetical protein